MAILAIIVFFVFGIFSTGVSTETIEVQQVCAPSSSECAQGDAWSPVTIDGVEGVIASDTTAEAFGYGGGWVPTVEQVTVAEAAISAEQGPLDHYRQYVGFTENGQQKIYINGFCDTWDTDWRTTPIVVMDGGDCYFGAVFNVDTGDLESFIFNGDA